MRYQPFAASTSAKPSYPLSDPILITFELQNRIEALARLAWCERIAIIVVAACRVRYRPTSIILCHGSGPLQM
jgi:hypothetical protein